MVLTYLVNILLLFIFLQFLQIFKQQVQRTVRYEK